MKQQAKKYAMFLEQYQRFQQQINDIFKCKSDGHHTDVFVIIFGENIKLMFRKENSQNCDKYYIVKLQLRK